MIYRDALDRPSPKAMISTFGASYGQPGTGGYFSLSCVSDAPNKRWHYESKDIAHIVAEMEADGWDCVVTKDGYNAPVIQCIHRETAAELEESKIVLTGDSQAGYIRFGNLPEDGRSTNKVTGEKEIGVSVYRAKFYENGYKVEIPWYSQGTYHSISDRRPIYRVWGEVIGAGSDGEPCITVTKTEEIA
jgi:hypothetical protein